MPESHADREDWTHLRAGDHVTVRESERRFYEATVDDLTEDSSVVWILSELGASVEPSTAGNPSLSAR